VNELERLEAAGYAAFCELAGGTVTRLRGGVCLSAPLPSVELNRVVDVTDELDVEGVAAAFGGKEHVVAVPPSAARVADRLVARGYAPGYPWMKFERDDARAPQVATSLRIEETDDARLFGVTACDGFGLPGGAAAAFGVAGLRGWHCFLAWDDDEPAAAASMFVDGDVAWFGGAATRAPFRGRGAQGALLAARIDRARSVGARRLTTETGAALDGKRGPSYRNILRAGFREAYLRPNWRAPA
jgi:GNAT superfamily N-acetyltransferase